MTQPNSHQNNNFAGVEGQTSPPTGATAETGWGGASARRADVAVGTVMKRCRACGEPRDLAYALMCDHCIREGRAL